MIALLFLILLLVAAVLLYRSSRRGRKLNQVIETNRDLRNQKRIQEIEESNDYLISKLTEEEENE